MVSAEPLWVKVESSVEEPSSSVWGAGVVGCAAQHSVDVRQGGLSGGVQGTDLLRSTLIGGQIDGRGGLLGQREHLGFLVVVGKGIGAGVVERDNVISQFHHVVFQMLRQGRASETGVSPPLP